MSEPQSVLGQPVERIDGRAKVTGQACYAGEFQPPGLLYGWVVNSAVTRGRIRQIDSSAAEAIPGVLLVLTHENRLAVNGEDDAWKDQDANPGSPFRPLFNDRILFSGQPVALVVAETLEMARYGASLVRVQYDAEEHHTDLAARLGAVRHAPDGPPPSRGDLERGLAEADISLSLEYSTPLQHHNPMEPHAATVHYLADGRLDIYDKTQGVQNSRRFLEKVFDMEGRIRVLSPFVGGAFGSGLRPQYQLILAMMAALKLQRSVRVTLTRQQMFTLGYRPRTLQHIRLGADGEGRLLALAHRAIGQTSAFEDFTENVVNWSGMLYQCPTVHLDYQLVPLDLYTPLDMRAPGAVSGVYALECALDELAWAANVDPLALRLKNYAERNQNSGKSWASKALRECYEQGAERFGWARRPPEPRSMRDGHQLVGWGMATGVWFALQGAATARARLEEDGRLVVSSSTADIGTGTYTVMAQIAAETLGLPLDRVEFRLGDSSLPEAPLEGGSATVSSVGSAVYRACLALREKIVEVLGHREDAGLSDVDPAEAIFACGRVRLKNGTAYDLTESVDGGPLDVEVRAGPGENRRKHAHNTHAAVFVEVQVDEDLGVVWVRRVVSAVAAGRIINPRTAANQITGGVVWGIGMALQEETRTDHSLGRHMNHSLAEYHFPVNADVGEIDVLFVEEEDTEVNDLGVKGVGEVGVVGVAAAIANAIYHATGKRVRDLPITPDKLL